MHATGSCPPACCRASGCTRCSSALLCPLHFEEQPPEQRSGSCPSPDPVQRGMPDARGVTSGGRTAMHGGHGPSVHSRARTSPLSAHSPHLDHKEAGQRGHTHHLAGVAVHLQQMAGSRGSSGTEGGGDNWCSSPPGLFKRSRWTSGPNIGSTVRLQRSSCSARFTQSWHLGEAGQAVGAVDVHGAGAADALAARPPKAQRLILQGKAGGRCASMWALRGGANPQTHRHLRARHVGHLPATTCTAALLGPDQPAALHITCSSLIFSSTSSSMGPHLQGDDRRERSFTT